MVFKHHRTAHVKLPREQIRTQIYDRTDQQPSALPPSQLPSGDGSVAPSKIPPRNKIRESLHLLAHPASVVPGLAQFATAPNMRDRKNDPPIQQAQSIRAERHRNGDAVTSISIQQQRRSGVAIFGPSRLAGESIAPVYD
jgi:hypothetical protein